MRTASRLIWVSLAVWLAVACVAQEREAPGSERAATQRGTLAPDMHNAGPSPHDPRPPAAPPEGAPPWMDSPTGPARALLDMIRHHRPELADRMEGLWRRAPGRFHDVLVEALVFRLEEALNEVEVDGRAGPGGRPRPEHREPPPPPGLERGEEVREKEAHRRELEEQHERLEIRSHELAAELQRLRGEGAAEEKLSRVREELRRVVTEQFEVRGHLRRTELERAVQEVRHLHELVERIERDLDQRERQREPIIERRMRQLLGEDRSGW